MYSKLHQNFIRLSLIAFARQSAVKWLDTTLSLKLYQQYLLIYYYVYVRLVPTYIRLVPTYICLVPTYIRLVPTYIRLVPTLKNYETFPSEPTRGLSS